MFRKFLDFIVTYSNIIIYCIFIISTIIVLFFLVDPKKINNTAVRVNFHNGETLEFDYGDVIVSEDNVIMMYRNGKKIEINLKHYSIDSVMFFKSKSL